MIKRSFLLLTLLITIAISVIAENVTVQTAQQAAQSFLNSKLHSNTDILLIDFAEKADFPNLYIFGNEQCFVIIGADNAVHPVLGYSTEGGFGTGMMTRSTYEWLKAYNEEIAFVVENRSEANDEILLEWDNLLDGNGLNPKSRNSVAPLLRTKWNQNAPFNNLCPADPAGPSGHCYTGCLATAMAQIMNYWEHPVKGSGSYTYTPDNHPEYGSQTANFGSTIYDWDNMKDYYSRGYTDTEALAVATLMYHCGVSLGAEYGPDGTGGRLINVPTVLSHYFKFSSNIVYKSKSSYTDSQWIEMLKQDLDLGRPLFYRGTRDEGNSSHAFVCDGYDENDYFHFNWGWSGRCDGFFLIGALNPQRNEVENSDDRGYNTSNAAIFNCYPKTPNINPPSNIEATANGRNVTITWSSVSNASHYRVYRDGNLIANNLHTTSYIDNNVTYGVHSYYVKSVKSDGTMSLKSNIVVADVHFPGPIPTNLQASVSGNNVNLSWQAPASENAILQYGSGSVVNGFGYDGGTYWAHRYPLSTINGYVGMAVEKVAFYCSSAGNYTVSVYKGDIAHPTELLHQQSYNAIAGSWQNVVFSSPVIIDYTKDLWIVFYSETNNPASYCSYSSNGVEDASLYSQTGQQWVFMTDRSWLIKTFVTNGTYTYRLYRDGHTIATNISGSPYTNNNVPVGFFNYHLTTNYFCGESDPSNTIRVRVGNPPCSVAAAANPSYGGTVAGNGTYNYGSTCTLSATPATGYDFIKWTKNGTQVSTSANYSFTVTEETSAYVGHFQLQSFTITPSANPSNGGTITGSGTYNYGSTCTLTATPATGYDFIKWTKNGTQVSTSPSYTFTVTEAATYVAHFQLQSFTISTSTNPNSGGMTSGGGIYNYGQTCSLTATPATGYDFIKWTKNGTQVSTSTNYSFTVTEAATYVAHFQLQSFTISTSTNPNSGGTTSGGGTYNYGQTCTLTATPATGYDFIKWTKNGAQVSTSTSYSFTVTEAATYVAHFQLQSFTINALANPNSGGATSGGGTYNYGQTCTLTATPATGYDFVKWTKNGTQVSTSTSYSFTVTEAATYVAHFQLQSFTISTSTNPNSGGTTSGGGTYNYGQTCTLTATPATGYDFIKWTKNGAQVSTSTSYSFTVTEAATYVAHFQLQSFTINALANPNSGGATSGGGTYNYGQTCTLTATPATGYDFVKWTKNGTQVSTSTSYSFTVTEAATYVAHFQLQSFTISTSTNPNSGGTTSGGGTYNYGQTCTLTATPATGYDFIKWTKNGAQVSTSTSYSFTVTEAATYVAHFQLQSFTITASANPNNSGTVSGVGTYNYGQTCTLTATPAAGYNFINWTENGNPVSNQPSYNFTVTSSRNLVANFTIQNYIITAIANPTEGGTISGSGGYNYGQACTLTATPATGYNFIKWTKNGTQVSTSTTYSFTVTEAASFVAHFQLESFTINASANPSNGGSVSGGGTYNYGQNCTLTATPATGYDFINWTKNGTQISTSTSYSFTVTEASSYVAHFQLQSFSINPSAEPYNGGTVNGGGTYNYGQTCTLTAYPATGYDFINWTKNGAQVSTSTSYSFTVTEEEDYLAHFQLQSFTIDASANPNNSGTISGTGTYNYGQTCTLTATPIPGYTFLRWTKNGTQVSTSSSYSFTVMESASFVAHFQLNNYVISISSNPSNGGTVSGGGAYHYGDNCTVTATTSPGFNFINWTENGNPVSNQPIYTFTITTDRNLVANFTTQNYIITAIANPTEGGTVSGSGGYNYGDNCTLSATANTGYVFQKWTKNGAQVSTNPSYSFTVTESATFVAYFTMVDYNISVATSPAEGGSVSGGGTFNYGQTCTVHASSNIGFAFIKWMENGTQVSDQPEYSFTVTGNRSLVAYFIPMSYEITAEADPEIGGIVIGTGTYLSGETATLSAVPNDNYFFQNWTEDNIIISESYTYTFTVDRPRHLVAHFYFADVIEESIDAVELFPNPTTDMLYIKGNGIRRVTLFNTLGQLVEDREVEDQDLVMVNVSSLKTGVYVIRIVTDQKCISKTFVKKN